MAKKKSELDKTPNKENLQEHLKLLMKWESLPTPLNPKTILSLDPGICNLGICLLTSGAPLKAITSKIELPKLETIGARVIHIMNVVVEWIQEYKPDLLVKEGPSFSTNGMADSGRVQAMIELPSYLYNIPLLTITPLSMRAYVGSSGKGKGKEDTKLCLYKKYGLEFNSSDEADAFGLAVTGLAVCNGEYVIKKAAKKSRKKKVLE
jgi:Holliday junction resolvasome RuvABC endonuclease subunit